MKRVFVILLLMMAFVQTTVAQRVFTQEFNGVGANARSTAMGGVSMAVTGDAYATSSNASAALFSPKNIQLAFGYNLFSGEMMSQNRLMSFGVYGKVAPRHMLAAGGNFYIEPIWNKTGKRPGAQRYELAYGYKASERFAFAVTARYFYTYGHDSGGCTIWDFNSVGLDFAVSAQLPTKLLNDKAVAKLGAKLTGNLGSMPAYNTYVVKTDFGAGLLMPFTDSHALEVGADIRYGWAGDFGHMVAGGIGAEYTLMQLLYFRIGGCVEYCSDSWYGDSKTMGYGTIGVGIRFFHLQCDVSYSAGRRNTPLANMVQFSVGLDF